MQLMDMPFPTTGLFLFYTMSRNDGEGEGKIASYS